jgi:hypothetical protein
MDEVKHQQLLQQQFLEHHFQRSREILVKISFFYFVPDEEAE